MCATLSETESISENPNVGIARSLTGNRQRSSRFVLLSGSEPDWLENSRATLIGLVWAEIRVNERDKGRGIIGIVARLELACPLFPRTEWESKGSPGDQDRRNYMIFPKEIMIDFTMILMKRRIKFDLWKRYEWKYLINFVLLTS